MVRRHENEALSPVDEAVVEEEVVVAALEVDLVEDP
jgi:hypothetical protein